MTPLVFSTTTTTTTNMDSSSRMTAAPIISWDNAPQVIAGLRHLQKVWQEDDGAGQPADSPDSPTNNHVDDEDDASRQMAATKAHAIIQTYVEKKMKKRRGSVTKKQMEVCNKLSILEQEVSKKNNGLSEC